MISLKKNIIIYDRQAITRIGISALVAQINPSSSVDFVYTKEELVKKLIIQSDSLVVLDYTLSDFNSIDGLLNIDARFEHVHWILFSEELSVSFLKRVVLADESFSVILKTAELEDIKSAINKGLRGTSFIAPQVKDILQDSSKDESLKQEVLTQTEQEIIKEIILGRKTKEIASLRNISTHTVLTHRKNIYRKLAINNAQELTRYALRAGIVDVLDYQI